MEQDFILSFVRGFYGGLILGLFLGGILCVVFELTLRRSIRNNPASHEKHVSDRKLKKLLKNQRNIAGQIKNALEQGVDENQWWGFILDLESKIEDVVSTITAFDLSAGGPRRIIFQVRTSCNYGRGDVDVWTDTWNAGMISVDGPNDRKLRLFIREHRLSVKFWSPSVPIVS